MKIDSIYFVVFCFAQLFLFSVLGGTLFPKFLASYNFIIWAVVCAIAFAAYPWLQRRFSRSISLRFVALFTRAAVIFILSTAVSFLLIGCFASDHFAEWQLGLFFISVPSAVASLVALLISYGFFRLNHNA